MKQCVRCKRIKSLSEFRNPSRSNCIDCNIKYSIWKKNNRKHCTLLQKNWDIKTGYYKKWYQNLKEKYGLGAGTITTYGFKLAIAVYDKFNRKCYKCGEVNDLTIHHLDGNGSNLRKKGLKMNNNIDNLVIICRKCHGKIHGREHGKKYKKLIIESE